MRIVILFALLCTFSHVGEAQESRAPVGDTLRTHILRTRDGSTLIGRVVAESADTVRFESNGALLALSRSQIAELQPISPDQLRNGEYWFPDPNRTRLFLAPTARTLAQGEGYFSDSDLLLLNFGGA